MVEIPNDDNVSPSDIEYSANLIGVDLRGADLSEARLSRADVYGAKMSTARVAGAKADGQNGEYITESHLSLMGAHVRSSDEPVD